MIKAAFLLLTLTVSFQITAQNQRKHKAIIRSFYEYLGEKNDLERVWELFDPSAKFFQVGEKDTLNLEIQRAQTKEFMSQFRDTKITIIKIIAEGDMVMTFTINRSTFVGKKGTESKEIEFMATDCFIFKDGRIISNLYLMDVATMRKQLTAKPDR